MGRTKGKVTKLIPGEDPAKQADLAWFGEIAIDSPSAVQQAMELRKLYLMPIAVKSPPTAKSLNEWFDALRDRLRMFDRFMEEYRHQAKPAYPPGSLGEAARRQGKNAKRDQPSIPESLWPLIDTVFKVIRDGDGTPLRLLADALEKVKNPVDEVRSFLAFRKQFKNVPEVTAKDLATFFGISERQVRRIAEELTIPLKAAKKGRPKGS